MKVMKIKIDDCGRAGKGICKLVILKGEIHHGEHGGLWGEMPGAAGKRFSRFKVARK
jgi:hypothetical protein